MTSEEQPLVTDVTAEILGERREEWRDGYDAGLRNGAKRVLESNMLEQIVTELVLLRDAMKLMEKREAWYRAKLQEAYHVILNPRRAA